MSSAGPGAPPCNGPFRAPMAPAIAETKSDPIDATLCRSAEQMEGHGIKLTPGCQVIKRSPLAVPEKVRRLLERGVEGQLGDGVTGDDQLALLSVHHAQFGLCGYNAFQPAH